MSGVSEGAGKEALHVWRLVSGDVTTWIAAKDEATALKAGREDYGVGEAFGDEPEPVEISQVPDDEVMTVGFSDDPLERDLLPTPFVEVIEDEKGDIRSVRATAKAWAENCGDGVYLCEME